MELIIFIIIIVVVVNKNKDKIRAELYKASQLSENPGKTPSQTNELSQRVKREQMEMRMMEEYHIDSYCKYTTQDPNFSFEGRPNNYDDFAELRKRNAAHERHLQQRIY